MTEAAHQMASNPLPPARASRERSGRAAARRFASSTKRARPCRAAHTGEIVIRGPNVMTAYENNPKANAEAFYDGWFRTGDQGVMDEDGYVAHHRPAQGDHQPRRREDLAARS